MSTPAAVLAPLLLAGVFLLSAWAKAAAPDSTLSAIILLRLPRLIQRRWVARALPAGEAVLALGLLAPWSVIARGAAWLTLALGLLYTLIVARALTFNPRPTCGCFGRIGDQRIVPRTLVRNLLLVAAAGVAVALTSAGHTVPAMLGSLDGTGWAWLVGATLVGVMVALIGGRRAPAAAPQPASSGNASDAAADDAEDYLRQPTPHVVLLGQDRLPITLVELAAQRAQLLVFANCTCPSSVSALRLVQNPDPRLSAIDVRMVFSGLMPPEQLADLTPGSESLYDHGHTAWMALGMASSPGAVLVGADGWLAGGPVHGLPEIESFIEEIAQALSQGPAIASDAVAH